MEIALEKLTKTDLIALIGQKDLLLKERDVTIQQKETEIAEKKAEILEKQTEIMVNKAEIQKLRRMLFGQKRERFETSPIQLPLDFGERLSEQEIKALEEVINQKAEKVKEEEKKARDADRPRGPHPGRSPLPKHLQVKEIVLQPEEDTTQMVQIGQEVSESLQYQPSRYLFSGSSVPNMPLKQLLQPMSPSASPSRRFPSRDLVNAWPEPGSSLRS